MSQGRYSQRGWAFQSFAFRTWGLAGADATIVITDPSQAGWITRTAGRLSVSSSAQRVSVSSTQQRVWVARSSNE